MVDRARHRQFQAAVLRQLYPASPTHNENEVKQEHIVDVPELLGNFQSEDDINCNISESPSDSAESCSQHLTRAQRKRIRKKKLKEAASNSKRIIGPLLPAKPIVEDFSTEAPKCHDAEPSGLQSQQRAAISDIGSSTAQRKSKQRRHAKRINQGTEGSIQSFIQRTAWQSFYGRDLQRWSCSKTRVTFTALVFMEKPVGVNASCSMVFSPD